jgi:predicted MPP superfamily phosphohydrolase
MESFHRNVGAPISPTLPNWECNWANILRLIGSLGYRIEIASGFNIEKAGSGIPSNEFSILLSHTPEIYQQAAHADFSVLLSGHTHGGQICLPGRIPITLDSVLPRYMGSGSWKYRTTDGYTSVGLGCSIVPVRFNCPPEITLHLLQSST